MLYFDHNATSPLCENARDAWLEASANFFGNPSSPHRVGARAETALDQARATVAEALRCDPLDLVWTSGATESNNAVFHHTAKTSPPSAEVWISAIEHPSVIQSAARYFPGRARLIPAAKNGVTDLDWVEDQFNRSGTRLPVLVALLAANNETGVLQPWRELLERCRALGVPFFCDATQWIGRLPSEGLGECDYTSGSAHKCGGPKGAGFLKCPARGSFHPLMVGGSQEGKRRAGTENVPGIAALAAALQTRQRQIEDGGADIRRRWREDFERRLRDLLPSAMVVGCGAERLWNTAAVLMPEVDCRQRWVVKLDKHGCAVSTGSACSSGREQPSHVLKAMGYGADESSRMIRISSGWETTEADWQNLLKKIKAVSDELTGS